MEPTRSDGGTGPFYEARKSLFARGIRRGRLTTQEIEEALPGGALTDAERWLLYYSLRAAQVEIVTEPGERADFLLAEDAPRP